MELDFSKWYILVTVMAAGGCLLMTCTGLFLYLFSCHRKNSETKNKETIKCPCGSDNIVMMKCAECQQPTTGCLECCRRLSSCVCDEDARAKAVARPYEQEDNLTSIVQEDSGGCPNRFDKLESNICPKCCQTFVQSKDCHGNEIAKEALQRGTENLQNADQRVQRWDSWKEQLEYQTKSNAVGTQCDCGTSRTSINPIQAPQGWDHEPEATQNHRDAMLQRIVGNLVKGSRSQAQVVCKQSQESPPRMQSAEDVQVINDGHIAQRESSRSARCYEGSIQIQTDLEGTLHGLKGMEKQLKMLECITSNLNPCPKLPDSADAHALCEVTPKDMIRESHHFRRTILR